MPRLSLTRGYDRIRRKVLFALDEILGGISRHHASAPPSRSWS
ncbi:MAG: hypothetical protein AVDCRST_MAG67-325 [uncultured Solirubrobacteraceae bacterium]|uniref:Uncharacterized protein n=1 Tax=uncultured Solirubrobacteraceae bacterium TaxID=1162706 RepID=A0A6J4RG78_9ACTN|nr:MAG: hypothetical protein AVDCRST_MAG67-325 [uncultured Solirubrobacteraceae bacterium]